MASPILWQNEDATVTLIDVPRSMEAAQGTVQHPCVDHLKSSRPQEQPYQNTEPKTAAAYKKVLQSNDEDHELHGEYVRLLQDALNQVQQHHKGDWCLPRPTHDQLSKKRKHSNENATLEQPERDSAAAGADAIARRTVGATIMTINPRQDPAIEPRTVPMVYLSLGRKGTFLETPSYHMPGSSEAVKGALPDGIHVIHDRLYINDNDTCSHLSMILGEPSKHPWTDGSDSPFYWFSIPPKVSFYLGKCQESEDFRAAIREQAGEMDVKRTFDLVLMDPPWPNRSVRRTHQTPGASYAIAPGLGGVRDLLTGLDLDMLMSDDALVGMWITNKPAIRDMVLGEGGLFDSWGVSLTEEWLWLKTTTSGEPVTPLDAVWRKPYEVLLLGRRKRAAATHTVSKPKRRVLISVPDTSAHSRKPCLKELLEPLLPDSKDYRALEIFARHLVAGWCSWGDECIKFNETKHWLPPSD